MIALGNESFEPEACAAYRTWFAPRPTYFVGPLLPDEPFVGDKLLCSQEKELTGSSNGAEVKNFLDTIRGEYGDHSLLYVCQLPLPIILVLLTVVSDFVWVAFLARW